MDILKAFYHPIEKMFTHLPEAVLSLIVGFILIEIIIFIVRRLLKLVRFPKDLKGLILSATKVLLWFILIIFIAKALGLGYLAAYISGSAIVLAFVLNAGAAPLIGDVISGIFLAGDQDFHVGMKVSLNEGKTVGVIKSIDTRKVRIAGEDGIIHILPNSLVEKGEWLVLEKKEKKSRAKTLREKLRQK